MRLFTETTEAEEAQSLKKPLIQKKETSKTEQQRLEWSCSKKWAYWWGTSCFSCCNDAAKISERLAGVLCTKAWQDLEPPVFSYDDPFRESICTQEQQKKNWLQEQGVLKAELRSKLEKVFYNDLKDHGLGQLQAYTHRFWENRDKTLKIIESKIREILTKQKQSTLEESEKEDLIILRQELEQRNLEAALYRAVYQPNFPLLWISCLDSGHICGKESLDNLRDAVGFWQETYGSHAVLHQLLEVMHQPHCRPLLPHQENFEGLLPELKVQSGQHPVYFGEETYFESRSKSEEIRISDSKGFSEFQNNKSTLSKNNVFYSEAPK